MARRRWQRVSLLASLTAGQIVIGDNLAVHKSPRARARHRHRDRRQPLLRPVWLP